ncbi:MAG: hypothetical protein V1662_06005, partial [Candidatus Omnitrophota bacterium]
LLCLGAIFLAISSGNVIFKRVIHIISCIKYTIYYAHCQCIFFGAFLSDRKIESFYKGEAACRKQIRQYIIPDIALDRGE